MRYSKGLGDGSHKTAELSTAATLAPQEECHKAQATFYHQLGEQLKGLWATKTKGVPTIGRVAGLLRVAARSGGTDSGRGDVGQSPG